jgi:O-antigen ligase
MKGLLLTYLLTYGGSFAALFVPFIGICVYYGFAVLRPQVLWFYSVPPDTPYSKYVALATIAGWVVTGLPRRFLKDVLPIVLTFGGFVILVQLSTWGALEPYRAEVISSDILKIFVMFLLAVCLVDTARKLSALVWVFIAAQGYVTLEMNLTYFVDGINTVVLNDGYGALNNNTFALSLLPGIGIALMMGILEARLLLRGAALFSALSSIHVILLSESRGAYLGVLVMSGLAFYCMPKTRRNMSLFFVALMVSAFLVGESVQKEFGTMFADELDDSAASRFTLWKAGWGAMQDHPFLGVGPGNFEAVSDQYGADPNKAVHNLYLQIGADCGVPALVLLLSTYALTFLRLLPLMPWKNRSQAGQDPIVASIAIGAFSGLTGYLIHSLFSSGVLIETPYLTIVIALAASRLAATEKHVAKRQEVFSGGYANVTR